MDAAGLAAFRVVFGALLLVAVIRYAAKGMIREAFVDPTFFFPLWSGLAPLSPPAMYLLFGLLSLLATCLMVGLFARPAAGLFCLLFSYAHFSDLTHYLNHYYLVTLLTALLAVVPSARIWSLDALRRGGVEPTVPAWTLGLLRFQVGCVYFFAGVAKWRSDWLLQALPLRIWLPTNGDFPLLGPLLMRPETAHLASWAGAAFDTFVPFLLLWRRSRPFALIAAVAFHLLTVRLFRLGMFPFFMIGCSLLFLSPDWPRRLLRLLRLPRVPPSPRPASQAPPLGRLATAALLVYVLFQTLFPLRQHLYPGHVLWSEQGYRFSWHVMLMEKTGVADFTLRDRRTGKRRPVRLRDHLTPLQIKMMSTQPDLIRDFARALARKEGPGVAVHAEVLVSLNGRPLRPLVDPEIDLAADQLPPAWILPFHNDPTP